MPKVLLYFANDTEECEALIVVDLLRRANVDVTIAAVGGSRNVTSSHKVSLLADALAEEVTPADFDLLVLPGGWPGTKNLEDCPAVIRAVKEFADAGKPIAAICAAPSILGHLGLLEGKRATSYVSFRQELTGATVLDEEFVTDGNITTSYGLGGAIPFGLELIRILLGQAEADRIKEAIAYRH